MFPGCCPSCGFSGDMEAFLTEVDAKRAIQCAATLDAGLGRVAMSYLRMFGVGRRGVTVRRAVKLLDELSDLVNTGSVCRDERGGIRRTTTPATWVAGIEQMLASPPNGQLQNHHYLRAVVFAIADRADMSRVTGASDVAPVAPRRSAGPSPAAKPEDPVTTARKFARQMLEYGHFSHEQHDEHIAQALRKSS